MLGEELSIAKEKHQLAEKSIYWFDTFLTVFRGREFHEDDLKELRVEIEENSKFHHYITKTGEKVKRIAFGTELSRINEQRRMEIGLLVYTDYRYCDDCLAEVGEYHMDNCDLEICPVCFGQLLSCGCVVRKEK